MIFPDRFALAPHRWARRVDSICAQLNPFMLAIALMLAAAVELLASAHGLAPQCLDASADAESGIPHVPISVPP